MEPVVAPMTGILHAAHAGMFRRTTKHPRMRRATLAVA